MTPSKEKKPLPCSNSMNFPMQPLTWVEWQSVFQQIKGLHLKAQYKKCSARCVQLLADPIRFLHPLHETYVQFYKAVSYESTGQRMHHLSKAKIPTLCVSKEAYEAAADSLSKCHQGCSTDHQDDEDSSSKFSCSSASSDSSTRTNYDPSKKGFPSSPSSAASSTSLISIKSNAPSPLHIRDVPRSAAADLKTIPALQQSSYHTTPPPKWQTTPPDLSTDFSPSEFPTPSDTWLYDQSSERYQQYLADFAEMLAAHITAISSLIESVSHIQATRDTVKRLASCGEDQEARAADLTVRIVRLKAQGWKRERFAPERYQELCERALEEC